MAHELAASVGIAVTVNRPPPGADAHSRDTAPSARREERTRLHADMVRFADGDRSAFDAVFSGLWPILRAFTARALRGHADAEDAAQTALLKIFSRIADFDPSRDATTWALAIASYEVLTAFKRQARRRETDVDGVDPGAPDGGPEDAAIAAELRAALESALGTLSDEDLATLRTEGPLGDTPSEKAAHRKRRQRAVERLKNAWRRLHGTP